MTLAQFHAALNGYIRANSTSEEGPTEAEYLAVLAEEMAAGRA